jgi:transposase
MDAQSRQPRNRSSVIELTAVERKQLEGFAASRSLPFGLVQRAQVVLLASQGKFNIDIAKEVGMSRINVGKWRRRFAENGISGLYDLPRGGRPRSIGDEQIAELLRSSLQRQPRNATHWSTRLLAEHTGVSKSTVQRVWNAFGIRPHQTKGFTLSNDPFFVEKVRDIVGLYLDPPRRALVLCVDEKSQCQALERMQPVLPMGMGYLQGVTHEYIRHGTLTLFAALEVASGKVLTQCAKRHRHQEFLSFLNEIKKDVPSDLDVHLIMDNYSSHKHPKVKQWLARNPRFHVHFTPTYSSWLNQVERWFGIITQRAIRRDSFRSTRELRQRIETFTRNYNQNAVPFRWHATADSILSKLARLCSKTSGTAH